MILYLITEKLKSDKMESEVNVTTIKAYAINLFQRYFRLCNPT